jgi:hypothetical protein
MKITDQLIAQTTRIDVMLLIALSYFSSVHFLQKYYPKQKTLKLYNVLQIYNSLQIILNMYMVYNFTELISGYNIFGINKSYTTNLKNTLYIHYLSKYLDYFDTYFMIFKGKHNQLSFLHIYHHGTIGIFWGILIKYGYGNGSCCFGAFANSIIHTIMYTHYLITSFGIRNPFKKYITILQLVQFYLIFLHSLMIYLYETKNSVPIKFISIEYFYIITMILLFNNFYNKNYKSIKTNVMIPD